MADTIYSYYSVPMSTELAVALGYEKPRVLLKNGYKTKLRGVLTIQITRPPVNSTGPFKYDFSYSFCSPVDNFSKAKARNICKIRKNSGKCHLSYISDKQLKARELSELSIDMLQELYELSTDMQLSYHDMVDKYAIAPSIKIPKWLICTPRKMITPIGPNK